MVNKPDPINCLARPDGFVDSLMVKTVSAITIIVISLVLCACSSSRTIDSEPNHSFINDKRKVLSVYSFELLGSNLTEKQINVVSEFMAYFYQDTGESLEFGESQRGESGVVFVQFFIQHLDGIVVILEIENEADMHAYAFKSEWSIPFEKEINFPDPF